MGQKRLGHVVMPAPPRARFVVIHPQFALALQDARLDRPAHAALAHQRDRDLVLVFIGTIRELSATILLTTANTKLVSVIIYDLNESGDLGAISVLGILLLLVSFAVVFLASRMSIGSARFQPRG